MRADHDLYLSAGDGGQEFLALLLAGGACQQGHFHLHALQEMADRGVVLRRQDFGWRHQAGLAMVVERQEHRQKSHQGLPAAHVALQQPVHLPAAAHVGANLPDDSLLSVGQGEWKMLLVEGVEIVANRGEHDALQLAFPQACRAQDVELDEKQLVELQAQLRLPQLVDRLGEVDVANGFAHRGHVDAVEHVGRERFGQLPMERAEQRVLQVLDGPRGQEGLLHPLGRVVVGGQPLGHLVGLLDGVDVGVNDVAGRSEEGGLAEDDVFGVGLDLSLYVGDALKPNQVDHPRAVAEFPDQPLGGAFA